MIPYTSFYFSKYTWQDSDLPNHPSCCLELLKLFFRVVQFWQSCWNCMCSLSEYSQNGHSYRYILLQTRTQIMTINEYSQNWHSYRYILLQTRTHIMRINQHNCAKGWPFGLCPNVWIKCMLGNTFLNSLWPSDAIWRQGSMSTLVQVMACCLMAPSHYLN